ncbi:MAG TPA: lycopene cyclase domain-containing protein [Acidimicrobiales bacterium]|nr:lycopene cyclase domain-containing protein [Acidimicrobiales bacterium]
MEYTSASIVACVVVIAVELFWLRTGLLRKLTFYVSWAIILFFMVLVDGWLTKLSAPIVLYNRDENSGIRFPWDIPVEDYLFGFALITLTMLLWERAGRGEPDDGSSRRTRILLIRRR